MPVDVINPDSTDPLALSEDRDVDSRRDATRGIDTSTATFEGGPVIDLAPDPEPSPVVIDTDLTNVQSNPNVPRVYPNLPANIVPPTELNLGAFQGDQQMIDDIIRGSNLALNDETVLNSQLSSVFNSGTPFGPNRPLFQEPDIGVPENPFPQLVSDSIEYRAEQAARSVSPIGIDPSTGEIVPGTRNALSGQPFSRAGEQLRQFVIGDTGTAFQDSLPEGQPIRNLGRRFSDVFRGYSRAFQTNQGERFIRGIAATPGARGVRPLPADRFTANLDVLSERVIQPLAAFTGADFQPTEEFEEGDTGFLEALTEESLLTRDLFTGLAAGQQGGLDDFAPLQGRFNDFGNAGILSLFLYAANLPEGLASGALYELTNFGLDVLTDREAPPDRVRLWSALQGRDLGFMNQADEARYLSFVDGDNHPGLLSRIGITNRIAQNAAGFVTDVIWGGVIAEPGLARLGRAVSRQTVSPAVARALPLQTLDGTNIQAAVRNIINDDVIPPAQSIQSINRLVDDALSAQSINRSLPLRVTPEVDALVRGTSRSLIVDADGIPLRVKVGAIGRAISGDVTLTPRVEVIDNLNVTRLAEVEQSILDTQSAVNENLVRITEARSNLQNIPEDASVLDEFSNVQIELIRSNQSNNVALNNRIQSLLAERRNLSQRTGQLNELALKEINESVTRQQTNLNGNVLETVTPDNNLDSVVPIINPLSIRESVPLVDIMQIYRADPVNLVPSQLTLTRRSDEQLTELARFHGLINSDSPTLSPQQIRSLQSTHANLLARYGNPIDNNLASPIKRLEINPPDPLTGEPQRSIIVDVTPPSVGIADLPPIPRRSVNNLVRRRDRLANKLATARTINEENLISNQIAKVDRRISDIVSQSSPDSVNDLYVNTLPRRSTPLTPSTQQVARNLANAEAAYKESAESARRVHEQLIQAQDIVQEQGRLLEELPQLERQTLQHEIATRNNFIPNNDGIPTVASRTVTEPPAAPSPQLLRSLQEVSDDASSNISQHIQSNGVWYHGTKSRVDDFSVIDYSLGSSVTNELGPGLYLTTDRGLGEVFAKAQPVVDRTPNPSLRSQNIGEVNQFLLADNAKNFIDASKVLDKDSPIRSLFIELVRDELSSNLSPVLQARLVANVRNTTRNKAFREWFHRLRVQWMRLRPDSQSELVQFNKLFTNSLADLGTPGAFYRQSNGHFTLALYNDSIGSPIPVSELRRVSIGTGQPEEQVLNRYAADLFAHNEIGDRTTKLNLESSRLNVDSTIVNNLKNATKEAYQQSLDDTQRMLSLQDDLDEIVTREINQQVSDINTNGPRDAANRLRRFRGDNNSPCI